MAPCAVEVAQGAGAWSLGDLFGKYIFLEDILTWICFVLK
jgi:hypothetical protein